MKFSIISIFDTRTMTISRATRGIPLIPHKGGSFLVLFNLCVLSLLRCLFLRSLSVHLLFCMYFEVILRISISSSEI